MSGHGLEGHAHSMKEETYSIHHWQPWVFASTAILVLSLVGLLGILLVPVVNRVLYNHLLQFLVAMAAGSLAGDALMHLLPEALGLHVHAPSAGAVHNHGDNHHHHDHAENDTLHNHTLSSPAVAAHTHDDAAKTAAVWKCCVCFAGIYIFFLIERLMEIFREYKRRRELASVSLSRVTHDPHDHPHCHTHVVGFKFSGTADQCIRTCDDENGKNGISRNPADSLVMETLLEKTKKDYAANDGHDHSTHSNHNHHGHSHGRTASPAPTNIASVAWMVILGDGIIDGLAVGVAFRTVSGGMSTSLAVLLHEIPHELGDFAVLLKSGMSVRLAVFYNLVSSVISFVGMCIGVVLGQSHDATPSWIFALAAGGFLYIALVDLLPELRPVEARRDESPLWHLGLQNLGLLVGVGIMVVIARFEGDIERAFGA
ncbi:zinc transporter ZIP10-like isoform X1 [Paramacrobiotus metropolitanus]|uniref:zinc transporter ZIP10-like isoform X1 n=1 Tax=Paramacrobiotus metropolitanus TaxID=2943436 RepID=UPI002445ED46|nr:zinc transporter ZIP10-like isoform X1 [Paramacrobiotus metropolitanus]